MFRNREYIMHLIKRRRKATHFGRLKRKLRYPLLQRCMYQCDLQVNATNKLALGDIDNFLSYFEILKIDFCEKARYDCKQAYELSRIPLNVLHRY